MRTTLRALAAPRRLLPVLFLSAAMVAIQSRYSHDPLAVPLAVAMCAAFVFFAPVSWRVLFPEAVRPGEAWLRLAVYAATGAGVVLTLGAAVPRVAGMGRTFLTTRETLLVAAALYLVGGWGLGRDIGFEETLDRERARARALAREAERAQLLALRSQLDPHFLFNVLNAIAEWCREDGEVAERAILQLSAMLRSILDGVRLASWPLERELELVQNLLALHRLRDPDRFTLEVRADPAAGAVPVPPMIVLPLADNAVKHGPAAGHRGAITVDARLEGGLLVVAIGNPGECGGPRPGSDGLPTLERRLALAYAGGSRLTLTGAGARTSAELRLPVSGPAEEARA